MMKIRYILAGVLVLVIFSALIVLQHSQLSALFSNAAESIQIDHPMINNILLKDSQYLRAASASVTDSRPPDSLVLKERQELPVVIVGENKNHDSSLEVVEMLRKTGGGGGGPLSSEEVLAQLSASGSIQLTSQPDDTVTTVVTCSTSKGNLTIDIRQDWGPNGASRYLDLVRANFFDDLPFFRVCPRYITQFGVKHHKEGAEKGLCSRIDDDPSLWGVRDMDMGYLFYAGSGERSRGCQMVLALCNMPGCKQTTLGTTFWEVPIGTVRKEGHAVLKEIGQTGYPYPKLEMGGQHPDAAGPNQGKILSDPNYLTREYPDMAYWRGCRIEQDGLHLKRPLIIDYPGTSYFIPSKPNIPRLEAAKRPGAEAIPLDSSGRIVSERPRVYVEFIVVIRAGADSLSSPSSVASPGAGSNFNTVAEDDQSYSLVIEVVPEWSPLGASRFVELVSEDYFTNMVFFRVLKNFMAQFGISSTHPAATRRFQNNHRLPDEPLIATADDRAMTVKAGAVGTSDSHGDSTSAGSQSLNRNRNRTAISALFTRQYPRHSNSRGTISYAMGGPGTRSCQFFINTVDNGFLDKQGFTPFARVLYGAARDGHSSDNSNSQGNSNRDVPGDVNIIDRIYNGYGEGGKGDGSDGKGPGQNWLLKDAPDKRHQIDLHFPKLSYIKHARIL